MNVTSNKRSPQKAPVSQFRLHISNKSLKKDLHDNWLLYCMLLPVIIWFSIFSYLPLSGLQLAFRRFSAARGIWGSEWVGWSNYVHLFQDEYFLRAARNTLIISGMKLMVGFPAPILIAVLLNEAKSRTCKRLVQTATFLPYFVSWVVVSSMVTTLLAPGEGPLSVLLIRVFGMEPINFMASTQYFRWVVVLSNVWKRAGWYVVVYLGAISAIDPRLYEASMVDGAGRLQRIWHITLPGMLNTIIVFAITELGWILWADFEQIYAMYDSSVYEVADIIDTYIYRMGLQKGDFGLSTAAGLLQATAGFLLLIAADRFSKRFSRDAVGII